MSKNKNSMAWKLFDRYFIQGLNGMALGLFSTLIIGLIIKQISSVFTGSIASFLLTVAVVAMSLTGPVIGIGVAHALKSPKLVILASGVTGLLGAFGGTFSSGALLSDKMQLVLPGAGDPLGAFIAVVISAEIGRLVSGKTKVDIIVTPLVTIVTGGMVAYFVGPYLAMAMANLGEFIRVSTELQPFLMGVAVSVLMGIILTLPISSAALSIILSLSGLAAGAATVGCSAQMIGFAVISFKANGWNGLLAQVPNIMRKPIIWLPPIVASAILGPLATLVFKMQNNPAGGGMGTSGLVGQLMTWQTMSGQMDKVHLFVIILFLHIILPAILSLIVASFMKKRGLITDEDYKLDL